MCNAPVPSRQQPARDIKDAVNIQKLDRGETTDNKFLKSTFDRVDKFGRCKFERRKPRCPTEESFFQPLLWLMYVLNFLDGDVIANRKLTDLAQDLELKGTQLNTCVFILFVGYLCGQVPSNMIFDMVHSTMLN
ncbi:hypothetical protein EDB80DRAFT_868046 [Ilyonectria destructans]|nr:hypothetical protein EDB80DRAFT_868046 [Ilyonectria destructans]